MVGSSIVVTAPPKTATPQAAPALAIAAGIALLVICACAGYDAWKNRRKYAIREAERKRKGGLH